jgi:hypothetical protein
VLCIKTRTRTLIRERWHHWYKLSFKTLLVKQFLYSTRQRILISTLLSIPRDRQNIENTVICFNNVKTTPFSSVSLKCNSMEAWTWTVPRVSRFGNAGTWQITQRWRNWIKYHRDERAVMHNTDEIPITFFFSASGSGNNGIPSVTWRIMQQWHKYARHCARQFENRGNDLWYTFICIHCYGLDDRGVEIRVPATSRILSSTSSRPVLLLIQPSIQWVLGGSFPGE